MRVLLLDDDSAVREVLSRGLTRFGNEVAAVASLAEARSVLKTLKPECAVLDMVLGAELGIELLPDLHLIDPKLPIIFITGNPDHPVFRDPKLGDVIYSMLEKPVSLGRLKTIMDWAAEKRKDSDRPKSVELLALKESEDDDLKVLIKTTGWKKIVAYLFFLLLLLSILYTSFDAYNHFSTDSIEGRSYVDSFMNRIEGYLKRDELRELIRSKDQRKLR